MTSVRRSGWRRWTAHSSLTLDDQQFDVYTAAADGSDLRWIVGSELLEEFAYWLP